MPLKSAKDIDYETRDRTKKVFKIDDNSGSVTDSSSAKKPTKTTQQVEKSPLTKFRKIWAKYGHIYIKMVNGHKEVLSVNQAVALAKQINDDMTSVIKNPSPNFNIKEIKKVRDALVENLIKAIRKAKYQLKHPETKEQELLNNAYRGLNRKGEKITAEKAFNDQILETAVQNHPYMKREEVAAVLRRPDLSPQQADQVLHTMNLHRDLQENPSKAM